MTAFEDFIRDELPLRQVVIKAAGDPTTGQGVVAAIGTYYLDTDNNFKRYEKYGSAHTDWREAVTSGSGTGVQTGAITFDDQSKITTIQVTGLSGTGTLDTFSSTDFMSCKYIINSTDTQSSSCTEVLLLHDHGQLHMTQYASLGDTNLVTLDASLSGGEVSLIATSDTNVSLSVYKFLLK